MIENTILKDFGFILAELVCSEAENRMLLDSQQPAKKSSSRSSSFMAALNLKREPDQLFCYPVKKWLDVVVGMLELCTTRKEGSALLEKFLDAHLIHFPYNRGQRKVVAEGNRLQPTAKGITILESWFYGQPFEMCQRMDEVRAILQSPFNTMELIPLERTEYSGRLYISTGISILLWNRMFGITPQIYDGPESLDDSVQNVRVKTHLKKRFNPLTLYDRYNKPEDMSENEKQAYEVFGFNPYATSMADKKYHPVVVRELKFDEVPYYSRSMIHPNSNNVMQYFDNRGLRFFASLRFEKHGKSKFHNGQVFEAEYIVSGRSLWQWIMDCTTVASSTEGALVAKKMLENGFLAKVEDLVVDSWAAIGSGDHSTSKDLFLGNECLYRFTPRGHRLITWGCDLLTDESIDQKALNEDRLYSSFASQESVSSPSSTAYSSYNASESSPVSIEATESFRNAMQMGGNAAFKTLTKLPAPPSPTTQKSSFKHQQRKTTPNEAISNIAKNRHSPINIDMLPFSSQRWGWEHVYDTDSAEVTFDNRVDIHIILSEPALRLLFRDYLQQKHCRGVLDFVDRSQSLLRKIKDWYQSTGTVTHKERLQKTCDAYIVTIQKLYIDKGTPFEINIADQLRKHWYFSVETKQQRNDFLSMVPVLAALRAECWRVLEGCVMEFKRTRILRRIPAFQQYVVAKTIHQSRPQAAGVLA